MSISSLFLKIWFILTPIQSEDEFDNKTGKENKKQLKKFLKKIFL